MNVKAVCKKILKCLKFQIGPFIVGEGQLIFLVLNLFVHCTTLIKLQTFRTSIMDTVAFTSCNRSRQVVTSFEYYTIKSFSNYKLQFTICG